MARTTIRTEDITASEVTTAKMAVDPTNASNLSSGSVPTAQLGNVDTAGLEDDIALLGFKVAANGSLAKYNLVDQTVDAFETEAGVDLSTSTGEYYSSSGNFYSGAEAAGWVTGDRNSGADELTVSSDMGWYDTPPDLDVQALVNGNTTYSQAGGAWFDAGGNGYIRFDHGSGNSRIYTNSRWYYGHSSANEGTWKWQGSADAISWTDIGGNFTLSSTVASTDVIYTDTHATMTSNTTGYRYYQCVHVSGNNTNSSGRRTEMEFFGAGVAGNMVLVSNATTAEAAPSKGDIVLTWTDGVGTATLGTDLTAEFSADNGSTWTAATLVDKGTTGSHNIASAHDITRTSTSGTSMRWRVKTLNQSASKETRIQAVSLGWS